MHENTKEINRSSRVKKQKYVVHGCGAYVQVPFRVQLGMPDTILSQLKLVLGRWISDVGKLDPNFYLTMFTMHRTIMRVSKTLQVLDFNPFACNDILGKQKEIMVKLLPYFQCSECKSDHN